MMVNELSNLKDGSEMEDAGKDNSESANQRKKKKKELAYYRDRKERPQEKRSKSLKVTIEMISLD